MYNSYPEILPFLAKLPFTNQRAVDISNSIKCHSRADKQSAARLLLSQHPSEDRQVFDWRIRNFVHITYPYFQKALNAINRIFTSTGFSWIASEKTTHYLKHARFFNRLHFNQFITHYVLKWMIEDPNAWLVVKPKQNLLTDSGEPELDILVIPSSHQLYQSDNLIVFSDKCLLSTRYSGHESGFIIDNTHIVHYVINRGVATVDFEYIHNLNQLPYTILGGEQTTEPEQLSFLQSFVEFGNQALVFYSEWQVTKSTSTFPIKEIEPISCPACHGSRYDDDGNACSTCGGLGEIVSFSPSTILVRERRKPGDIESQRQKLEYISPPVDILQEQKADWQLMLDKALESINMHFVLEQQSGIAKDIDRMEFYSFLHKISTTLFDNVMYTALYFVEKFMRGTMFEDVVVIKPTTFSLLNDNALYDDLKNSFETPFSPLRVEALQNYWRVMSNNEPVKKKIASFLTEYDVLFCNTTAEATIYHDVYAITQHDIKKHIYAYAELTKLIREKEEEYDNNPTLYFNKNWFLDSSYNEISTELDRRITERISSEEDWGAGTSTNTDVGGPSDIPKLPDDIRDSKFKAYLNNERGAG